MSVVLTDANGYVADIATNLGATRMMTWLEQSDNEHTKDFVRDGISETPQELAAAIEALLSSSLPSTEDEREVVAGLVGALKKCESRACLM